MEYAMSESNDEIGCLYTKSEIIEMQSEAMDELLEYAGGPAHLAKMLNLEYNIVISWKQRGRISKSGAKRLAAHPRLSSKFPITKMLPGTQLK